MKKISFIALLSILLIQSSFAQSERDELRRQMQELQEKMNNMMEQFGKNFGGNLYFFDTTFTKDFNFDGNGFRFDTSFVKEFHFDSADFPFDTSFQFHFDNFGNGDFKIDTFFMKEFRGFEPGAFPHEFFNEDFPQDLQKMMEQLMQRFDGYEFHFKDGDELYRNQEEKEGIEPRSDQPKKEESPALKKKRKTTIL